MWKDEIVMAFLGLAGAMPVFLLVGALRRQKLAPSMRTTMRFLGTWGGVDGGYFKAATGVATSFLLLVALAYAFSALGQDRVIPTMSSWFSHFGYGRTAWSVQHEEDEWDGWKDRLKAQWGRKHPGENLADPSEWEKWKKNLKREEVRIPRPVVWYGLIMIVAGLYDLSSRTFRRRGLVVLAAGVCVYLAALSIWAEREDAYIRRVFVANGTLGELRLPRPASLRASYWPSPP